MRGPNADGPGVAGGGLLDDRVFWRWVLRSAGDVCVSLLVPPIWLFSVALRAPRIVARSNSSVSEEQGTVKRKG
jgi:hypothetical protein